MKVKVFNYKLKKQYFVVKKLLLFKTKNKPSIKHRKSNSLYNYNKNTLMYLS